uniref:Uncharacterized protein n=1 Tax=Candidatus Kentrum sp. LFY TaxID=2126342 RepID=A0A450V1E7_9GAMM|nr:MAG: hypothetical protein BECKLFY1418B_GA0070995_102910 [Candidatus Kentron sp. LFY]VFJ98640.1 MAG: hypothetical protein BECKLFY1418A_GA0070994_108610 [Candidatus Kentron sp. LFY]
MTGRGRHCSGARRPWRPMVSRGGRSASLAPGIRRSIDMNSWFLLFGIRCFPCKRRYPNAKSRVKFFAKHDVTPQDSGPSNISLSRMKVTVDHRRLMIPRSAQGPQSSPPRTWNPSATPWKSIPFGWRLRSEAGWIFPSAPRIGAMETEIPCTRNSIPHRKPSPPWLIPTFPWPTA